MTKLKSINDQIKYYYILTTIAILVKGSISTEASNRIEGIFTSDDRLKNLVQAKTAPRNREESEIAGYRDVLNTIHENYDYIPISSNYLLQLHRDLYKFLGSVDGGKFKTSDIFPHNKSRLI